MRHTVQVFLGIQSLPVYEQCVKSGGNKECVNDESALTGGGEAAAHLRVVGERLRTPVEVCDTDSGENHAENE